MWDAIYPVCVAGFYQKSNFSAECCTYDPNHCFHHHQHRFAAAVARYRYIFLGVVVVAVYKPVLVPVSCASAFE